ncbi:MAG: AMP-binding protein [Pseudomonadota bacterium]
MSTMVAALVRAGTHFGARDAMLEEDGTRTCWREHVDRVARLATGLRTLAGEPGSSRFAVLAPNSVSQAELIHAGYWSGTVPVPLNFRLAPPELAAMLRESEAKVLFAGAPFIAAAEQLRDAGWAGEVRTISEEGDGSTGQIIADSSPAEPFAARESGEAILMFTGGTTGAGKGVPLTHQNVVSNGLQVGLALGASPLDVMLHVAPMFHSADLLGTAITLAGGAHSYLAQPAPDTFAAAVAGRGITFTMIPPVLLRGLVHGGLLQKFVFSGLRIFISGGAPVPFDLLRRAQEHVPNGSMVQGYGLTETSPILTFMHLRQAEAIAGGESDACRSAGLPLANVETRLIGREGSTVPEGEPGELAVRGPNVFGGYLNRPAETADAFHDGWFRTGDIARIDSEGFVHIIDRSKDVIITGAENVYSAEVEAVLSAHPQVSEAAVIGIPDEKWGERVAAIIVPALEGLDEEALGAFCRERIAGFKIPRQVFLVSELPKSPLGKVLKGELRKAYATGHSSSTTSKPSN